MILFDDNNIPVMELHAKVGSGGPANQTDSTATVELRDGTATLYEKGEPTTILTATRIVADQKTLIVVGTGNVRARSLVEKGSPAIRADTMTWKHKTGKISGAGNVLITSEPDIQIPGTRFEGDMNLKAATIYNDGSPATGSF